MSLCCTVSEIWRDIGRKSPIATYAHLCLAPPLGWPCWNFAEIFGTRKLESLCNCRHCLCDPVFSRFGTIPACNGRTDGQMHDDSIYRVSIASRGNKNRKQGCTSRPYVTVRRDTQHNRGRCDHGYGEVTYAGCIAAGVGIALSRLSVCLSVCPHSKRKTAWAINTKFGTRVLYSSRSACIDAEVKRSRSRGYENCRSRSC